MSSGRVFLSLLEATRVGALALLGTLTFTACGQKGPLFLPDRETTAAQPPASDPGTAPESEEPNEDKEKPR